MIQDAMEDSTRKQLVRMLHRAARVFTNGYCLGLKDLGYDRPEPEVSAMVMAHMDDITEKLATQFGIEWSDNETQTLLMTVKGACMKVFMPF